MSKSFMDNFRKFFKELNDKEDADIAKVFGEKFAKINRININMVQEEIQKDLERILLSGTYKDDKI